MYIRYRVPTVMEISIVNPFNESSNRFTYDELVSESVKIKIISKKRSSHLKLLKKKKKNWAQNLWEHYR